MTRNVLLGLMLSIGVLTCAAPASSAPTAFDCDVPSDHFSSVSQDVVGPMTIKGTVQFVQMRSGNNLPVAGARLVSSDGNNSVGFQLIAASARAKQFDVVLNLKQGDDLKQANVAQIATDTSIPFDLSLSETGKVKLTVGGNDFNADFIPIAGGKEMAFCSTAQFKFADILFSTNSDAAAASGR